MLLVCPIVSLDHCVTNIAAAAGDVDANALNGRAIVVPEGVTLTSYFDRNRAERGDSPAYRFIDYSQEQDGRVAELS